VNVSKVQGICTVVDPLVRQADGVLRASAALLDGTTWDVKQLTVYFMNGTDQYHQEVQKNCKVWEQYAAIEFVFVNDPNAMIRVSFEPPFSPQGQFNSVIGAQAKLVDPSQPTVNLGFLPNTAEDEFARLILHEFGHTLGLIHEHQSPNSGMVFLQPQVFRYFAQFGWSADMVQANIINRYTNAQVHNATAFDPLSIMLYPFPAEIAQPPSGINRELSESDKDFIASIYPGANAPTPVAPPVLVPFPAAPPGIPLVVGEPPKAGFLVVAGTMVLYNLTVTTPGTCTIETGGDQAWTAALYGTADLATPIAQDVDGSGQGLNARIIATLTPGTYFLALAHLLPDGTGPFTIAVRGA
jgi:hypothetical protein